MKILNKVVVSFVAVLLFIAPVLTTIVHACAYGGGETEIPEALKAE
jgi:hypothetical protein